MHTPFYYNPLPLPVAQPKMLALPLSDERYSGYLCGQFDLFSEWKVYNDETANIPFQTVDLTVYQKPRNLTRNDMDPRDAALLAAATVATSATAAPLRAAPSQRQLFEQGSVNWMRKPEYTTNNLFQSTNKEVALADERKAALERINKLRKTRDNTAETKVATIEATFDQATRAPVHRVKAELTAVSVLPIFPDDAFDSHFAWIEFTDGNPTAADGTSGGATSAASAGADNGTLVPTNALIADNTSTHTLYLKTAREQQTSAADTTANADNNVTPSERETFKWIREYNLLPTPSVTSGQNLFVITYEDRLCYAKYETRKRLAKRARALSGDIRDEMKNRPRQIRVKWSEIDDQSDDDDQNMNDTGDLNGQATTSITEGDEAANDEEIQADTDAGAADTNMDESTHDETATSDTPKNTTDLEAAVDADANVTATDDDNNPQDVTAADDDSAIVSASS